MSSVFISLLIAWGINSLLLFETLTRFSFIFKTVRLVSRIIFEKIINKIKESFVKSRDRKLDVKSFDVVFLKKKNVFSACFANSNFLLNFYIERIS